MCFSVFISILISTILVIIHFLFLFLICLNLLYLLYSIYINENIIKGMFSRQVFMMSNQ